MAKTAKKRQTRPGRIARQAELLTTVYKVVSEFGIDAASMRQIATRAKVSTGTIIIISKTRKSSSWRPSRRPTK